MSDEDDEAPSAPQTYRPRTAFNYDAVKAIISKHFKIYESDANVSGVPGHEIAAFYVQSDAGQFSKNFEEVRREIREHDRDLMVILQYRMGEDVLLVARKPPISQTGVGLNVILFVATIITTTLAGSLFYAGYEQAEGLLRAWEADLTFLHWRYLALGFLSFSLPVMAILGIHELGHFFVAKRHHVRTSFPYFIPVPPIVLLGTFGAFISIKEPIPDRKALFDIGAAGPAAGFFATIPVLIIGLFLTGVVAQPLPPVSEVHGELIAPDGTAWGFGHDNADVVAFNETVKTRGGEFYHERVSVNSSNPHFSSGNWSWRVEPVFLKKPDKATLRVAYVAGEDHVPPGGFQEDEPGNFSREFKDREIWLGPTNEGTVNFTVPMGATLVIAEFQWDPPPSPVEHLGSSLLFEAAVYVMKPPEDVLIHPTGFAGWVGLLITGFNLLPAGQLDGGHVARAVLGNQMKWASYLSVIGMVALSYLFLGWLVLAILILLLGIRHPPPLNDKTVLDGRRKFLAFLVVLMLAVSFVPFPFVR